MNILKSFESRKQKILSNNFNKSKYGKNLLRYKGIHKGERCFIIGNGPSLTADDLNDIIDNGVVSFAANRVFRIFDNTRWRPQYYVCEDEYILNDIWKDIPKYELKEVFIPIAAKWYRDIEIPNANYYLQHFLNGDEKAKDQSSLFNDDITKYIITRSSVLVTCIQLAVYMGFSEINLLGVDHSFSHMKDKNGNIIVDNSIKDHFGNQTNGNSETKGIFNVDATTQAFIDIYKYLQFKNIEIYNATRGGKLEVFPRVDFDTLFK